MVSDLDGATGLLGSPAHADLASPRFSWPREMDMDRVAAWKPVAARESSPPPPPPPLCTGVPGSAPISRAQSPPASAAARAMSEPLPLFVPLSEVGGAMEAAAAESSDDDVSDPACRPASAAGGQSTGYESGDDMDFLSMRHCINCTASLPLAGSICMDCGHCCLADDEIFNPAPLASAPGGGRRSLQGDALVAIAYDERMEQHEEGTGSTHPERPDRIRAVMARLQAAELVGRCVQLPARPATREEVEACHSPGLLVLLDSLSDQARLVGGAGSLPLNSDTYVNRHSAECARLSAGCCVEVARAVVRGDARAGLAVVRPPGHHAESNTSMGFCLFNNAGIAARAAQAAGARRVLILDWDVHHGNGTQEIFEDDPSVMYCSLHRYDGGCFYPGTGAAHETGHGDAAGCTVNVPWPCGGMRNGDYLAAFNHVILPIAQEFRPDLVIISAGFDAAEGDPIGGCHLTPEGYAHMTALLQLVAPTVALLEGGYNLLSTARGMEACVRVLLGERPPPLPEDQEASEMGMAAVALAMRAQARHWCSVRLLLGRVHCQLEAAERAAAARLALAAHADGGGGVSAGWPTSSSGLEPEDAQHREAPRGRALEPEEAACEAEEEEDDECEGDDGTPHQRTCGSGGAGWSSDDGMASDPSDPEAEEKPAAPLLHVTPAHAVAPLDGQRQPHCQAAALRQGSTDSETGGADLALPRAAAALCEVSPAFAAPPAEFGLPTPPVQALAAASTTPDTGGAPAPGPAAAWQWTLAAALPARQAPPQPREHWKRLAMQAVQLKRTMSRGQRLSPSLGDEMLALAHALPPAPLPPPREQQQQQ